jgi:hypothetical protein
MAVGASDEERAQRGRGASREAGKPDGARAMSATTERPAWPQRIELGQEAEQRAMAEVLAFGWSVLPYGLARLNAPVPPLQTPKGPVRPCDFLAYPPDGRPPFAVEVKAKDELRLGGYGLDADQASEKDCWQQLQLHDRHGGPALLVVVDPNKKDILCATVRMLSNPEPTLSLNGRLWRWPAQAFMPLANLLRQ